MNSSKVDRIVVSLAAGTSITNSMFFKSVSTSINCIGWMLLKSSLQSRINRSRRD